MTFVDVAVPAPLAQLFTYRAPPHLADKLAVGMRVVVEFGRTRLVGVVMGTDARAPEDPSRAKDVLDVLEEEPAVPAELVSFLRELSSYYFAPIGEVLRTALPPLDCKEKARAGDVRRSRVAAGRTTTWAKATAKVEEPGTLRGNASALLALLRASGELPISKLQERFGTARAIVKRLAKAGLVDVEKREVAADPFFEGAIARDVPPEPTEAQAAAVARIVSAIEGEQSAAFLLHGVTGSGKTEVYLRAIAAARAKGRSAIVLVPEIALTPQLVARFRARFGDNVAVLHSALSLRERRAMWRALRDGEVHVAIGARSAIFAPAMSLGLVIVDEEHDPSFKQEEGVRYHARDMAMLRAHRAGATCILGSATPSLESEHLARTGKIERLRLPARAHAAAVLPEVLIVDLKRTGPGPSGDKRISVPLHRKIDAALARKEATILFLNRRGFAPSVVCEHCGRIASCPHCSVALTLHRRGGGTLRCHYCDHRQRFDGKCISCKSARIVFEGLGTERLEESVARAFPGARVARLDRDVGGGKKAEAILAKLRAGEIDVLVGTQMVAKGHDMPGVTLVGVVNADAALSMPDFRASERAFHLMVQVAGRAGRGDARGTVVLQTYDPEHVAIVAAAAHDVDGFAERELKERAELRYPPFSRLALVRLDAPEENDAIGAAEEIARVASASFPVRSGRVDVLGPAPAPIARLRGRYRFHVLLRAKERPPLRATLAEIVAARARLSRTVRAIVDVDPVSML